MKKLFLTIGIALLSVGVCIFSMFYVMCVAQKAEEAVDKIQSCVASQQYKTALKETNFLIDFLEENHTLLSIILHHEMLEELEESLEVIKCSLEHPEEKDTDFWQETTRSLIKLKNLKDTEVPSVSNIL